ERVRRHDRQRHRRARLGRARPPARRARPHLTPHAPALAPLGGRAYPGASHAETHEGTSVAGTVAQPEGITNPPIDRLLETVDSKYALVLYASQRARQINAYYSQLS